MLKDMGISAVEDRVAAAAGVKINGNQYMVFPKRGPC
jgi:hypothetical protein